MCFSARVVFTWGWFGGHSWATVDGLTQMSCSALFLLRWPQTHSHSERDLKIEMFPAWGRPRARFELLFSAFLLELRQCPCSCGFPPIPNLAQDVQLQRAPCGSASDARAGKGMAKATEQGKGFSLLLCFSLCPFPMAPAHTNIGEGSTK